MEDVFEAYFECRKKKRNTCNALAFESDYERRCVELWREINAGTYRPSRSIAFIINKPVKREIFAADFRGPCGTPPHSPQARSAFGREVHQ